MPIWRSNNWCDKHDSMFHSRRLSCKCHPFWPVLVWTFMCRKKWMTQAGQIIVKTKIQSSDLVILSRPTYCMELKKKLIFFNWSGKFGKQMNKKNIFLFSSETFKEEVCLYWSRSLGSRFYVFYWSYSANVYATLVWTKHFQACHCFLCKALC